MVPGERGLRGRGVDPEREAAVRSKIIRIARQEGIELSTVDYQANRTRQKDHVAQLDSASRRDATSGLPSLDGLGSCGRELVIYGETGIAQ